MAEVALKFILGRKRGMTQRFTDEGTVVPVTVVTAGPCVVTRVRRPEVDGLSSIQLGYEDCRAKVLTRPILGELGVLATGGSPGRRAVSTPAASTPGASTPAAATPRVGRALRFLREARLKELPAASVGDTVTVSAFQKGDIVDVIGVSKGRGFQGTIRAHHFNRGPASHGSMNIRQPGSVGSSADPSHTFRGQRMALHLGADRHTAKNLRIFDVDSERHILFVRGSVAGPTGGLVVVRRAKTPPPPPKAPPAVKKSSQKGGPEKKAK